MKNSHGNLGRKRVGVGRGSVGVCSLVFGLGYGREEEKSGLSKPIGTRSQTFGKKQEWDGEEIGTEEPFSESRVSGDG